MIVPHRQSEGQLSAPFQFFKLCHGNVRSVTVFLSSVPSDLHDGRFLDCKCVAAEYVQTTLYRRFQRTDSCHDPDNREDADYDPHERQDRSKLVGANGLQRHPQALFQLVTEKAQFSPAKSHSFRRLLIAQSIDRMQPGSAV